jgi:hypothetical protein
MSDLNQAIEHAIGLATRLRTMSEKMRDPQFKGITDNLLLELAELQLKLESFSTEHATLKAQLNTAANPQGERCPRCFESGWKVTSTRPDKNGRIIQTYSCPKCKLKEDVLVAAR